MKIKTIENESNLFLIVLIGIVGGTYLAWQLIGLRFTNHDDIYFHLYAKVFSDDYLSFAKYTAIKQARIQAFISKPIALWVNNLGDSALFDIFNIGTFGIMYGGLTWFLSKIANAREALAMTSITLLLFPLHYYFTFPQGYPVMATWGLAFAFVSAGLFGSHLQKPKLWKLLGAIFLFSCSFYGSEYNFILHPVLLICVFFAREKGVHKFKRFGKVVLPFAFAWLVNVVAYLSFSVIARESGGDAIGRVHFSFDIMAWIKTFLILTEKSVLPLSLCEGIGLTIATAQGGPDIPAVLCFSSLWHGSYDILSLIIIYLFFLLIFFLLLYWQRLSVKSIRCLAIAFFSLATIPCLILSMSAHYQMIVSKGYLQGHLTSFYTQLGFSGLVFLLFSYANNCFESSALRMSSISVSAVLLASLATVTFIYNNSNRQAMIANKQKWEAVHQFIEFVKLNRIDFKEKVFYAPDFWSSSGVSTIPGNSPFNGQNYWSEYSRKVLNTRIKITDSDNNLPDDAITVKYFSTPSGTPVVILSEKFEEKNIRLNTLVASQPVTGKVIQDSAQIIEIQSYQWKCATHCTLLFEEPISLNPDSINFKPDNNGPRRLISQFFLSRKNMYAAYPLGRSWSGKLDRSINEKSAL